MIAAIGTTISAEDIQPGMIVDTQDNERITVYQFVVLDDGSIELQDHLTMPHDMPANAQVTVRGYFNPDVD